MDIYQLNTFVTVARLGSITRASKQLHLSQPAVSAHIKVLEETLGLALFERTPKGMTLTQNGQRLKEKAEQVLEAHQAFVDEAICLKGHFAGRFRLGVGANSDTDIAYSLLTKITSRYPEVEISLQEGDTDKIINDLLSGSLDAGFYNETHLQQTKLTSIEVSRFKLYLVAPPHRFASSASIDWKELAEMPWFSPTLESCCGRAMEDFFQQHQFHPKQIIRVDREITTRNLVASGVGVGMLHEYTAKEALQKGDVALLCEVGHTIRTFFACLTQRKEEPFLSAVISLLGEDTKRGKSWEE